jgi:hypothetical protein
MSKCPKCDRVISTVSINTHSGLHAGTRYPCLSFDCPSCGAVLSITFDPYRLSELIAQEVRKGR